jgi:hypothetical protein
LQYEGIISVPVDISLPMTNSAYIAYECERAMPIAEEWIGIVIID